MSEQQIPSGIAWSKLRRKFFDECTDPVGDNPGIRKINMAPHDFLEWLKDAVAECREFVMLPQPPSFADMVREKLPPLEWRESRNKIDSSSVPKNMRHLHYYVGLNVNGSKSGWDLYIDVGTQEPIITHHNTPDEAKAAAQEHYISKVLELFKIPGND